MSLSSLPAAYIVYAADRCISLFSCDMVEVISALSAMTFGNHLTTLLLVNENSIKTFSDERDKKNIRECEGADLSKPRRPLKNKAMADSAFFTQGYLTLLEFSAWTQSHGAWTRSRTAEEQSLGLNNAGRRILSIAWGD